MTYFSSPGIERELTAQTASKIFENPVWDKYPKKYGRKVGGYKIPLKKAAVSYLLRNKYSLPKLAELLGYDNHTTVLKNAKNFKSWLDCNDELAISALKDVRTLLFNNRVIYK